MPELPRITRSLRMFTDLGRIKSTLDLAPNDLPKKRKEQTSILKRCFLIYCLINYLCTRLINYLRTASYLFYDIVNFMRCINGYLCFPKM